MSYNYNFPESDLFSAMEITHPEFDIMESKEWADLLYQELGDLRAPKLFDKIKFELGLNQNKLPRIVSKFMKGVFSGHRGSGKTVELIKFSKEIDKNTPYLPLFIPLAQEIEIQQLEPEYLLPILIAHLIAELDRRQLPFDNEKLNAIAQEFLSEKQLVKELEKEYGFETEAGIKAGFNFWKFIGIEGAAKGIFSRKNRTTETFVNKIRINQKNLIQQFNEVLEDLRKELDRLKKKDILFIIDDFEKTKRNVYEAIFIHDTELILKLRANIICCVPIDTFYKIQDSNALSSYKKLYLPMIRLSEKSIPVLRQMVAKRIKIDKIFESESILDNCIQMSGGCVRQLMEIIHNCLSEAIGNPISETVYEETIKRMSNDKYYTLSTVHQECLKRNKFDSSDSEVLELLQSRAILEYNGTNPERKLNPLLLPFFT